MRCSKCLHPLFTSAALVSYELCSSLPRLVVVKLEEDENLLPAELNKLVAIAPTSQIVQLNQVEKSWSELNKMVTSRRVKPQ